MTNCNWCELIWCEDVWCGPCIICAGAPARRIGIRSGDYAIEKIRNLCFSFLEESYDRK